MARDKRKVVIQSDNEARHSPRQKRARPLMQSRSGVVISEPTKRHVTSQAKHVEARTKARFDHSTTPKTTKLTTTPPHPRTAPPTTSPTCPPSLGVCDDAPGVDLSRREFGQEFSYDIQAFSTYEPTTQSMRLLDRYYFLALMDLPPYFYAASVREFFSTLEDWRGGYRELHFSIRGQADIISSDTIVTAFGLPSSAPPEARFAPQSRPAFPRIARILAPQGTRCRSAITRLEMSQILWFVDQVIKTNIFSFGHSTECFGSVLWGLYHMYTGKWWSPAQLIIDTIIYFFQKVKEKQLASTQSYLIPLPRLLSYYLLRRGHQLLEFDRRMASHTYVINQWVRVIHSESQLTTHGTRRKRDLHVVPLPSTIESPLPSVPTFDTSLPVLPISLPPPLSGAPEPAVPISTPAVPVFDLPRPSQPQVADATSSTLSIMARLDTLQELFVSMDSRIDARLSKLETRMDNLTFFVQQLTSLVIPSRQREDFVTPADTSLEVDGGTEVIGSGSNTRAPTVAHETMPILQTSGIAGQVDGEIFIRATDTGMDIIIQDDPPMVWDLGAAITPIVEITDQATTPMLEEIAGVVTPIIGA
ncbi:hypothetical protein CK203_019066 [Vitis vinifera]|uniref:Uncharacterized protein n=1 Tax=Vitis vinifera TaxID=29760 RepID=A0A438IQW8_VITVI|nr:hypothetical protein CK203_019066 [Vitis vinifera]